MAIFNREQRPLKRPRIGPPDCYPQMTKQKEDDLSSDTLKNGFKNVELVEDEIGSAKPFVTVCNFSRLGSHFKAITEEKQRLNNVYDVNKKKNQVNLKDVYWPVTAKNRTNLNAWLQDLAINKSLKDLSKKIPTLNSNRKEEVFQLLSDNSVPLARSAWFIKLLSTGYNTSSDSKKKRPGGDLSHDWTQSLTKYLKDLLSKLSDHSHGQGKVTLSSDILSAYKQFLYNSQLADWLYQYIRDITASQSLARVLAGICTRYISYLYYHNNNNANEKESKPSSTNSTDNGTTEDWSLLAIYNDCQRHYPRLLLLTCILQIIAIFCPGALVYSIGAWNKGSSNDSLMHHGSPLDYLPGSICQLPGIELLEARVQKQMLAAMKASQSQIQLRSTLVENRWSSEKCKESDISVVVTQVLSVLEIHDKGAYARHNNGISVENLYTNIFPAIIKGSLVKDVLNNDEAIIMHLLEWAVTPFRYGFHRPILVAILLERRQGDLERMNENDAICNHLYYQELLLRFLDYYAILPSDDSELELEQSNASFKLLVALFAELIRRKVFSHDKYIMTLISRGDISTTSNSSRSYANSPDQIVGENDHDGESDECSHLGKKNEEENVIECGSPFSVRRDSEADISDQLKQQLSQQQEELQQLLESNETNSCNGNMDIMEYDNATDDVAFAKPEQENIANKTEGNLSDNDERGRDDDKDKNFNNVTTDTRKTFQHIAYVLHFPLPDIDLRNVDVGSHESRQRFTVLYGVGESRNLALQEVTEMWDEINSCVDYLTTCDSQNSSSNDSNRINYASYLAPTIRKFKTLHIYSQYVLANTCANLIMENVIKENRYPSINKFNFVADLMEIAGDINGFLQFVIRLLSEGDSGAAETRSSLVLTIVAVFRRYYNCLLVSLKQATEAVEGLWRIVKHITNPASCSSADRCALACLADIFTHCSDLKLKNRAELESVLQKVKDSLPCSGLSKSNDPIDWKIFGEEFKEPRRVNSVPVQF
ncbi:uncharacterized protein TRIADDRAFT_52197 [Trichoplax adhaerens]|uniref:Mediator complex subunit Med12 domain-containing protein n=1 Tax=Trichoplax adhaerens TaxID=10228 RepID=B3RM14_TRIAD|nr:hypothetical protein TRIADDRAFT_52197 [Trichoplax adhaerens]EDV28883.1 hypothetical protein TRIADDRAFT_52197 [Trichoplax adhaerens]|eukprot:XP_002108085.1 hypothetical protein TRIADDRAFT_52197 [Trichoplax adhaerens]